MSLNQNFVDDKFVEEISTKYEKETQTLTESYELITKPFKVLKFIDFLNDPEFISAIRGNVEKIQLDRKNNDLYSLWQSGDLQNYPKLMSIRKFIEVLKNEVAPLLEKIVKVKFNKTLSITASLYKHGDMLLCHDDKCDDRCVAFVYYLTGGTNEMGGAFEMFDHSNKNGQPTCVVKSIPPEKNSFLIFEVGNYTYHQVSEVRSQNFERLSINGWFHSDRKLNFLKYKEPFPNIIHQKKGLDFSFLDEYINVTYLTPSVIVDAQKEFEINSFILLKNYFVNSFFKKCLNNLKNLPITWKEKGPPNRRKYDVLDMKKITGNLDILINLLRSPSFFAYLKNITGLDIIASSDLDTNPSKMTLEVQRWTSGCYTMATDNDSFFEKSGLDMYLFFNSQELHDTETNGGSTSYLAADEDDDDDDDNELLNINPEDNALIMVYRTSDTIKFTKCVSHLIKEYYYCISATYFEPNVI